jgi:hypothetical protein
MKNVNTIKERETGPGAFEPSAGEDGGKRAVPKGMKSEKGIVLVVVLVLSAVVLAVMTALIYMITSGTQISGLQRRYKTSLEAARGGSEIFYQVIGTRGGMTGANMTVLSQPTCSGTSLYTGMTYTGLQAKLMTSSSQWVGCNSSLTINLSDAVPYDMMLVLGGTTAGTAPQYTFYGKIVGSIEGNSASLAGGGATGGGLYEGSVITGLGAASGSGSIPVVSKPYLYAIEADTENSANASERAKFSIIYMY